MIGPFRRTLPNPWFWRMPLMMLCLYAGMWLIMWPLLHMEWDSRLIVILVHYIIGIMIGWSLCAGFYRATAFNPLMKRDYYDWVVASSWSEKCPLPHGPMTLVWQDVALVILLCLPIKLWSVYWLRMEVEREGILWLVPAILFATGYLTGCLWQFFFYTRAFAYLIIGLGFIAMAVAPFPYAFYGLIPCVIAAEIGLRYIRKRLARGMRGDGKLPKPIMPDVRSALAGSKRFTFTVQPLGWPHNRLAPAPDKPKIQVWEGTTVAFLLALGAYCIISSVGFDSDKKMLGGFLLITISVCLGGARLVLYLTQAFPPINFFGRILTGRWIIPSYDIALIPPMLIVGIVVLFFRDFHEAVEIGFIDWELPLEVFAVSWIALCCPPRLSHWRLTSKSRLFPLATSLTNSAMNQEKGI